MSTLFNPNELILEKVRELILTSLNDGSVIGRLTSLEEPTLKTSAEGEDIKDAFGSTIATLYKAKNGEFTATNSLFSFDLAAMQYGATKEVADDAHKINVPVCETLAVKEGKVRLSHAPVGDIKYIYLVKNKALAEKYTVGAAADADVFSVNGQEITVPTSVTEGSVYVEYEYESATAVKVTNNTEKFPEAVGVKMFCIFRDPCNETVFAGAVVAPKGKLDPTAIEQQLTSGGKHPFTIKFNKDYCANDADLFSIIVAQ